MENNTNKAKEVQGTEVATVTKVPNLNKFDLEAVTIRLSERKLLIPLTMVEEFNTNEKLWEKFKTIVEKTKETAPAVTVMYTVAKMEV